MPKLGTGEQEYTGTGGTRIQLDPVVLNTIVGQGFSIGIHEEPLQYYLEYFQYSYDSLLPAENSAVSVDSELEIKITEIHLGVNYHLERELAGIFSGIGISNLKEELNKNDGTWTFETYTPYIRFGLDMIFGGIRIRGEQLHFSFGKHYSKTSILGIVIVF